MNHSKDYWEELSKKISKPRETKNKRPDTSQEEADFIIQYLQPDFEVLDLGSGTGLIVNKITPYVKSITAVEKFKGFSKFIKKDKKVKIIHADVVGFYLDQKFDVVLCTGLMQYLQEPAVSQVYSNMYRMLKKGGTAILRNHCGLKETVVIDHSEEVGENFFAEYRQKDEEKKRIEKVGFQVEILDKAPKALNVWENTRHFMFICKK